MWWRVAGTVVWGLALGALLAAPFGGDEQRLSVELWLIVTAVWLAWSVARRTIAAAPVAPGELRGLLRRRRSAPAIQPKQPRELLALEGMIIAARDHERAFAHRLRPRLRDAVDHSLRFEHGVDAANDPSKAEQILGPSAWLVDPQVDDRKPTLAEIDELLDLLEPRSQRPDAGTAETAETTGQ